MSQKVVGIMGGFRFLADCRYEPEHTWGGFRF